jgi:hypothetical protein
MVDSNDLQVREDIGKLKANSDMTVVLLNDLKNDFANHRLETNKRITKLEHSKIKFAGFLIGAMLIIQITVGDATKALAKFIGAIP